MKKGGNTAKSPTIAKFEASLQQNLNKLMADMQQTLQDSSSGSFSSEERAVAKPGKPKTGGDFARFARPKAGESSSSGSESPARPAPPVKKRTPSPVSSSDDPSVSPQKYPISKRKVSSDHSSVSEASPPKKKPTEFSDFSARKVEPMRPALVMAEKPRIEVPKFGEKTGKKLLDRSSSRESIDVPNKKLNAEAIKATVKASAKAGLSRPPPKALPPPARAERPSSAARSMKSSLVSTRKLDAEEQTFRVKYDKLRSTHKTLQDKFDMLAAKHERLLQVVQKLEAKNKDLERKLKNGENQDKNDRPRPSSRQGRSTTDFHASQRKPALKSSEKFLLK